MDARRPTGRRPRAAPGALIVSGALIAALAAPAPATTVPLPATTSPASRSAVARAATPLLRSIDSRRDDAARTPAPRVADAQHTLAGSLGPSGVVQIDPRTATPRVVADLDGFLTPRSDRPPAAVALGYVRAHLDVFGLDRADLASLTLVRDYADILGTRHLVWQQRVAGIPVFDDDLRAAVTADGRLAWIGGSPLHIAAMPATTPRLSAGGAAVAVRRSVDASRAISGADTSHLVWFGTVAGPVLAWQVEAAVGPTERYLAIVDAERGRVLWRSNQVRFDDVEGQGLAWGYYPSDLLPAEAGVQQPVTFPVADATALSGNNAHVVKQPVRHPDEIPANGPGPSWSFPAVLDTTTTTGLHCSTHWACTWDSRVPWSWRTNMRMASAQLYYSLNTFHDHLEAAPIGFTEAAGNFQLVNQSGQGLGGDPMGGVAELGAGFDHGLPDGFAWNAFFDGGRDGDPASVNMLMFPANLANHIAPSSDSAIDASVVYHEYTHGLSTRLLVYADGSGALNFYDSYAVGEAWSDWYALDFLAGQGYLTDTPAAGEIVTGYFIQGGQAQPVRSEPMDCPVGSVDPVCPGGQTGHLGGYTLGDLGHVIDLPEPHADGEIWSQTLWDLRDTIGQDRAEMLVTRAMEMSAPDPSFLEMRNSILLADRIAYHGGDRDEIWQVFAARGMGYFATESQTDVSAVEDFSLPPECPDECGKLHGTVTDAETGQPLAGVRVSVPAAEGFSETTDASGEYAMRNVPLHTYSGIAAQLGRYEPGVTPEVEVTADSTLDIQMHRDWAARSAGGSIVWASGHAFGPRYNPSRAIDLRLDRSWITFFPHEHGHHGSIEVDLGQPIDVVGFGVAPDASRRGNLNRFVIQTRTFHGSWVTAALVQDALPRGSITGIDAIAGTEHVRFVRMLLVPRRHAFLLGVTELSVRGAPSP